MKILAIETSCDETAAAVVEDLPAGRQVELKILSNIVASSTAMHEKYGGIVPEVAAREQLKCIIPVITEALSGLDLHKDIDAIAVTVGPGLIGSLLVGVETAKTLAFVTDKPIIPVNHVIAHMYANFVRDESSVVSRQSSDLKMNRLKAEDGRLIAFPAISLVVSGGHTELYLMKSVKELHWLGGTLDDAAGECFDKTARLLGFGHGGGLAIEKASSKKSDLKIKLPRPMMDESFNFSFSGLKTAVMREWKKLNNPELASAFAHEIQESITDVLVKKTLRAAKQFGAKSILLSGGVAANTHLREKFRLSLIASRLSLFVPPPALCTDNAVMIASYAYFRGKLTDWHEITATPDPAIEC